MYSVGGWADKTYCKDKNCLHNNNTKTYFLHGKSAEKW